MVTPFSYLLNMLDTIFIKRQRKNMDGRRRSFEFDRNRRIYRYGLLSIWLVESTYIRCWDYNIRFSI